MKPKIEHRHYPRKTAYIIAEYTVREGTFRDIIKNIGAEGFFIRTNRKVAHGQPISVSFPLFDFDNIIHVKGRVTRNEPGGFAISLDAAIEGLVCKEGYLPEIVHESDRIG